MAVLPVQNPTLLDLAKRSNPDGSIADIIEMLNQTNEVLPDMTWVEGNLVTGHRTTVRTGIPEPTWRRLYQGVQPTKSTTAQITDNTGMLEAYAEVDKALADLAGNTNEFRLSEDRPHLEGMNQRVASTIFYGNEGTNPGAFTGLAPRFNSLSAENGENIIDAGGVDGDILNSIWLVVWGESTVHGIVPKGSIAGLQHENKGQVTIENVDGSGGRMEAYRTHYRWDVGLTVRDWRYVVRIANIPVDKVKPRPDENAGTDIILPDLMFEAIERIPALTAGRAAFYMSRKNRTLVRQQTSHLVRNSTLTVEQIAGVPTTFFHGVPLRRVDALAADEARVV